MPFWKRPEGTPTRREAEARRDQILESIEKLSFDLAEVKGDLQSTSSARKMQRALDDLKQQISDAKIEKSRIDEDHARERREIEHHVGLERERVDLEIANAKQQAQLDARQENLKGKEDLFEEHMKFYKEQMDSHIDDVKNLLNQVMTRIPTVSVDRRIRENISDTTTRELPNGE